MSRPGAGRPGREPLPGGRRWTVWLAVLAVVAQAVLFEFAMAARDAAEAEGRAAAHHAHHGSTRDGQGAPTHEHGKDCPFCVARAAHQAPSLPAGVSLPLPSSVVAVARPAPRRRVRARRRPARFSSRSPPHRSPLLPVA